MLALWLYTCNNENGNRNICNDCMSCHVVLELKGTLRWLNKQLDGIGKIGMGKQFHHSLSLKLAQIEY